jgi:hypothetical protein
MVFTFGMTSTVIAYNDCLDEFAGEVAAGLTTIDSFYNDDGTFYTNVSIDSKVVSSSTLYVATCKKVWWWYENPSNYQYISSLGMHYLTYTIPTGQYKLYFEASSSWITFHGAVYDNN